MRLYLVGVQQDTTDNIRKAARSIVDECSVRQKNSFASWGVCANWKNDVYFTADKKYEAKQIELFWRLYDAGLIYRELKPVYWSPSSQTSLAEAELEYNEKHESTAAFVAVPIVKKSDYIKVISQQSIRMNNTIFLNVLSLVQCHCQQTKA